MMNEQANEMLALLAEMILEQRRANDRMDALEKELRYYADATKLVLKNHEARLSALEHE